MLAGITFTRMLSSRLPQPVGLNTRARYHVVDIGLAVGEEIVSLSSENPGVHWISNQSGSGGGTSASCTDSYWQMVISGSSLAVSQVGIVSGRPMW